MFRESSDCGACVTRVGVLEDCAVYIESGEVSVECSFKLVGSWVVAFLVNRRQYRLGHGSGHHDSLCGLCECTLALDDEEAVPCECCDSEVSLRIVYLSALF